MKALLRTLLLLAASAALLAADERLPHVTALGTATVRAQPDLLRWQLTVQTKAAEAAAAADAHGPRVAAVLQTLKSHGLKPADLQTAAMSLAESREYRNSSWIRDGFAATTRVAFTLRDPAAYRDLWLALTRLPDVAVDQVTWDLEDRISLQNRARLDALKAARDKARQMAAALEAKIAEPLAIEEIPLEDPWTNRYASNNSIAAARGGASGEDETVAPGEITVRCRVQVTFRLVSP